MGHQMHVGAFPYFIFDSTEGCGSPALREQRHEFYVMTGTDYMWTSTIANASPNRVTSPSEVMMSTGILTHGVVG